MNTAVKTKLAREKWREKNQEICTVPMFLPPSREDMINAFEERDRRLVQPKRNTVVLYLLEKNS